MINNGFVPEIPSVTAVKRAFDIATSNFVDEDHEERHLVLVKTIDPLVTNDARIMKAAANPLSQLLPDAMFCWGLEVGLMIAAIMAEEASTKNAVTTIN